MHEVWVALREQLPTMARCRVGSASGRVPPAGAATSTGALQLTADGAKGFGEFGVVGFAAAVATAIYHATGVRVRALSITPDKQL